MSEEYTKKASNFIETIVEKDLAEGKNQKRVHTRFPPEPNGYLHIGHAKAICIDFGIAAKYGGKTNLRFDDTNPTKEDVEYVDSIKEDIKWLGFDWEDREYFASDYFQQLYEWAQLIIKKGKAYIDDQTAEEIAGQKGTPTKPGMESPYRNRSVEENLDLFQRMRDGEFEPGARVLRAKIDMASSNMHLRDPLMYRIVKTPHHRTGNEWSVYPMYDFAHGQSDYLEGITHSICTLEFDVHRPLYDWFLDQIVEEGKIRPQQIEFARLNLNYTVMSKRKLLELVQNNHVSGWDDPRMPTISGLRRRGYTPSSIRNFVEGTGATKVDGIIDVGLLEHSVKEDLNKIAPRVMVVLDPVKIVIENYPENQEEMLETVNNPEDETMGKRTLPFSREIYIERNDFMEDPPKKFFRLRPEGEVRLKSAYIIKCENIIKDAEGNISEIRCTYDPDSKSGGETAGRKVKGTLHWVSAKHAIKVQVKQYDRLFLDPEPDAHKEKDFKEFLNPDSLTVINACYAEPSLKFAKPMDHFQFQRLGYFNLDTESTPDNLVFNRTVPLRDSWSKQNN